MGTMTDTWARATTLSKLEDGACKIFRTSGKQIALFRRGDMIYACNNRCPHEGYPLSEGDLDGDCVLTCNWHNWKFNLESGENLYGGDRLRVYPVETRGEEVWIDLAEQPLAARVAEIMLRLREAYDDNDYQRMARELARLVQLGADPLDAVRGSIRWSHDRMEFGWTHAYAATADWLALYAENDGDPERQLVCLLESVAHMADDALREERYPYSEVSSAYDEARFVDAIDREDEAAAVACMRGALEAQLPFADVERGLSRAALLHYNDFGHSIIYVTKAGRLIDSLGSDVAEPVLLSLTRSLIYTRREDRIPEFRRYSDTLDSWGRGGAEGSDGGAPEMHAWRKLGINKSLDLTARFSGVPAGELHGALLGAAAANMLAYDLEQQDKVDIPISDNIGWLDFTHGITFSSAVRMQCEKFPELWPAGLLQIACFIGRNAAFTVREPDLAAWQVDDADEFFAQTVTALHDHNCDEFIVSAHLLKTVLAARAEIRAGAPAEVRDHLAAAINRFLNSPLKRKQARRTAHQALKFVALDG
jgi:nitrite reductase/ring-hydroxylating ferredoxin subunit